MKKHRSNKIVEWYFLILMFSPIISYFTVQITGNIFYNYWRIAGNILFILFLIQKSSSLFIPKYLWLLFLYASYISIRHYFSGIIEAKGVLFYFLYYNHNYTIFFLLIIIENTTFQTRYINKIYQLVQITLILSVAFIFIQVLINPRFFTSPDLSWGLISEGDLYRDRRFGLFGYVSRLSNGLSFLPLASIYISFNKKNTYRQVLALVIIGIVCFATNSRWIMVGFFILLTQFLLSGIALKESKKIIYRLTAGISITIIILFTINQVFSYSIDDYLDERLFVEGSIENSTRYKAIHTFRIFFPDNPIWGTGVHITDDIREESRSQGSSQIHVGFLSHLVSYGLIGSLLLFSFWYRFAVVKFKQAKISGFDAGFFSIILFISANVTLVTFSFYEYGMLISWVLSNYFYKNSIVQHIYYYNKNISS